MKSLDWPMMRDVPRMVSYDHVTDNMVVHKQRPSAVTRRLSMRQPTIPAMPEMPGLPRIPSAAHWQAAQQAGAAIPSQFPSFPPSPEGNYPSTQDGPVPRAGSRLVRTGSRDEELQNHSMAVGFDVRNPQARMRVDSMLPTPRSQSQINQLNAINQKEIRSGVNSVLDQRSVRSAPTASGQGRFPTMQGQSLTERSYSPRQQSTRSLVTPSTSRQGSTVSQASRLTDRTISSDRLRDQPPPPIRTGSGTPRNLSVNVAHQGSMISDRSSPKRGNSPSNPNFPRTQRLPSILDSRISSKPGVDRSESLLTKLGYGIKSNPIGKLNRKGSAKSRFKGGNNSVLTHRTADMV